MGEGVTCPICQNTVIAPVRCYTCNVALCKIDCYLKHVKACEAATPTQTGGSTGVTAVEGPTSSTITVNSSAPTAEPERIAPTGDSTSHCVCHDCQRGRCHYCPDCKLGVAQREQEALCDNGQCDCSTRLDNDEPVDEYLDFHQHQRQRSEPLRAQASRRRGDDRFVALMEELYTLHTMKDADYAGEQYLSNFKAAWEWDVPPSLGVLLRLQDKLKRLQTFYTNGALNNESAFDSLRDIAVYAMIAHILLEEELLIEESEPWSAQSAEAPASGKEDAGPAPTHGAGGVSASESLLTHSGPFDTYKAGTVKETAPDGVKDWHI